MLIYSPGPQGLVSLFLNNALALRLQPWGLLQTARWLYKNLMDTHFDQYSSVSKSDSMFP